MTDLAPNLQENDDKARSIILSTYYEINGEYRGKTEIELRGIAQMIAREQPFKFDDADVMEVIDYAENIRAVPASRLIIEGLRWLLPPIVVLCITYVLLLSK